jgi:DNA-binding transcriptional LysR family regulator
MVHPLCPGDPRPASISDNADADGRRIAFLPEEGFAPHVEQGRLVRVLEDWCRPFAGYFLCYPGRRQSSPAFSLVVDALRVSGAGGSRR